MLNKRWLNDYTDIRERWFHIKQEKNMYCYSNAGLLFFSDILTLWYYEHSK